MAMDSSGMFERHITELIMTRAKEVYDPCALAHGISAGMVDMGILRSVSVRPAGGRWAETVGLRLTSPGCMYFSYFELQLGQALKDHADIDLRFEWDDGLQWTESDLAPGVREQMLKFRQRVRGLATPQKLSASMGGEIGQSNT
jgi:metal-sulfur cluster biosynthetic enzyme